MKYYPLSKIKTGLTSKPGEFKLTNPSKITPEVNKLIFNGDYVGPYIKTYDNKFFTGKSLSDENGVFELTPLKRQPIPNSDKNYKDTKNEYLERKNKILSNLIDDSSLSSFYTHEYNFRKLTKKPYMGSAPTPPPSYNPLISDNELMVGEISRYFCKHKINKSIKEISNLSYEKIKNQNPVIQYELYDVMKISWLLDDRKINRITHNKNQVDMAERIGFKGLKSFIKEEYNKIHF